MNHNISSFMKPRKKATTNNNHKTNHHALGEARAKGTVKMVAVSVERKSARRLGRMGGFLSV
jgi:hypothetical protein